ncbi:MAG TPA: DUF6599 family protein [Blastocatellia bacterium]|nr:DUF6599 family protein [Blastocatellia bacterium]
MMIVILLAPLAINAQAPPEKKASAPSVTPLATSTIERLLPDSLAGFKATGPASIVATDNLSELVGDNKSEVYREYRVASAVSREYAGTRVDIFETKNQFAAFGLFTYNTGRIANNPAAIDLGSGGARIDGSVTFWKGNFFVRVGSASQKSARGDLRIEEKLARAVADSIASTSVAVQRPPILDSLPAKSRVPGSEVYVLGPESLTSYAEHGRDLFGFAGDTEAVIGAYVQAIPFVATAPTLAEPGSASIYSPLRLVIVEYHTPQFATDAMTRAEDYASTLPEGDRNSLIIKRTGNYIVAALGVRDRDLAESLIGSIEYPYTVKWLRNPLWPTNDPFRAQKAAEMLLSTFGLLGLILLTVLTGGAVFGTTIFLKRRKRQREVFSDAGGMLRLDIDHFESALLGLPPKRSEE